ncbi:MAG: hypothetical protein KJ979_00005, partial [Gammaproteobacteria bacterium]|nr:hypothetical protein [Gammaproteobacteria bacterium]MBU0849858.1 hypothetical protein [Gammaproteobacteria bacterium]MBU2210582.1 hypothetical protein [Gammaproteobacteria bacterium]
EWFLRGLRLMISPFLANIVDPKSRAVIFYPYVRISGACSTYDLPLAFATYCEHGIQKLVISSSCSCTLRKKLKMVPPVAMSQILHRFVTRM